MTLWMLALAFAAVGRCPQGDAPAPLGEFEETAPEEQLLVDDGAGVLSTRFVLKNPGDGPASFFAHIPLPRSEGFAFDVVATADGRPIRPRLDEAETAGDDFAAFVYELEAGAEADVARAHRDRTALLVEHSYDGVSVSVAAACSVRQVEVVVKSRLVSVPVGGGWRFRVPVVTAGDLPAAFRVTAAVPAHFVIDGIAGARSRDLGAELGEGPLDGDPQPSGPWDPLREPDPDGFSLVDVYPSDAVGLLGRSAAIALAPSILPATPGQQGASAAEVDEPVWALRAELDLPDPLATTPNGLRLVFVVDASVSASESGLTKSLALLEKILDAAPQDARWALVAFHREVRVVVPAWRPRSERRVPAIEVGNGSDVLAALETAHLLTSDLDPDSETGRIIVLSDLQRRDADSDDGLLASSIARSTAPLTHVAVLPVRPSAKEELTWSRLFLDADPRAQGPEATGGILVEVGAGGEDERSLALNLIRPTRIDRPMVVLGGHDLFGDALAMDVQASPLDEAVTQSVGGLPDWWVAGSGLRLTAVLPQTASARPRPRVRGWLWGTAIDEVLPFSRSAEASVLGLVATGALSDQISDALVRRASVDGHVVSRTTSLVAVPPFRPAAVDGSGGGFGRSFSGYCGCCGTRGVGIACTGGRAENVDLREQETLEALLREDMGVCGVREAHVEVETSSLEILSIKVVVGGSCVAERMWRRRLDQLPVVPGAFTTHRGHSVWFVETN